MAEVTYIAGHTGLVGGALLRRLPDAITRTRAQLDLTNQQDVDDFFHDVQPQHVYLAAAKVGGISANAAYPADFIRNNLAIQLNVIDAAYRYGCEKLLFLGSSCIYPRNAEQPIREDALLTSPLEPTNQWYAIAKIAGLKLCEAYRKQYGFNAVSVMPTNLYGPDDHFDSPDAHVIPMLVSRFYHAIRQGQPVVTVWGSGKAKREFLHVDDLADALTTLMARYDGDLINIGSGEEVTIRELAHMIADILNFRGEIRFDTSKPDGPPRKVVNSFRVRQLWRPRITLRDGLEETCVRYVSRMGAVGSGRRLVHQVWSR